MLQTKGTAPSTKCTLPTSNYPLPAACLRHASLGQSRSFAGHCSRVLTQPIVQHPRGLHRLSLRHSALPPGDDSPISTKVNNEPDSSNSGEDAANGQADGSASQSSSAPSSSFSNSSTPAAASEKKGLPQRWRVTIMMAVSFVLCNMDKVRPPRRIACKSTHFLLSPARITLGCRAIAACRSLSAVLASVQLNVQLSRIHQPSCNTGCHKLSCCFSHNFFHDACRDSER